jgi:purine-binding chemotaxis protein CheW
VDNIMKTNAVTKLNSYLSFQLGKEVFALNVGSVITIIEIPRITKIPRAPEYLKGVINLRGEVLPVIDIHYKFGLNASEISASSCILVMEVTMNDKYIKFGILVDSVTEVHEIEPEQILPPPSLGGNFSSNYIDGMYKIQESFIMLVNSEKLIEIGEATSLKESTSVEALT